MSSAANHRARSHRSQYRHSSAMRGERQTAAVQGNRYSRGYGAPLIFGLQAMRRRIMERAGARKAEQKGGE